jgi:hypothetical protein
MLKLCVRGGYEAMIDLSQRKYWPILAFLLFLNVCIFGCLILMLTGKIVI